MPAKKEAKDKDARTFEEAFRRLTEIVEQLESGEGTLSEMTQLFEEGVRLSGFCTDELDSIEKRVEILLGENLEDSAPFDEENAESP